VVVDDQPTFRQAARLLQIDFAEFWPPEGTVDGPRTALRQEGRPRAGRPGLPALRSSRMTAFGRIPQRVAD
jgi:hypothetical protein